MGEPLFFLELDPSPGRVTKHCIEIASLMYSWESKVRMQKLILVSKRDDLIPDVGFKVAVFGEAPR